MFGGGGAGAGGDNGHDDDCRQMVLNFVIKMDYDIKK